MASACAQLRLVFWKNWKIQLQKPILTLFEIGIPFLVASLMFMLRHGSTGSRVNKDDSIAPNSALNQSYSNWKMAYVPDIPVVRSVMKKLQSRVGIDHTGLGYETVEEMRMGYDSSVWGGIVFTNEFTDPQTLPKNIEYSIEPSLGTNIFTNSKDGWTETEVTEYLTQLMIPEFKVPGPRADNDPYGGLPYYLKRGFLAIQRALDLSIMEEIDNSVDLDSIEFRMNRVSKNTPNPLGGFILVVIYIIMSIFLVQSFILIGPNICKDVLMEKEHRLKEFMKMMGLRPWIHWLGWFLKSALFMLIIMAGITFIFKVEVGDGKAVIPNTHWSMLFVFLMLYSFSMILFCLMVSVFVKKASNGAMLCGALFFLTWIPSLAFEKNRISTGIILSGLLCNSAFHYGLHQIHKREVTEFLEIGEGIQWSNFYKPATEHFDLTMAHVFLMLVFDCFLYAFIIWYFDNINPGDYGVPKPWYFPFTRQHWCGQKVGPNDVKRVISPNEGDMFEAEPSDLTPGIQIMNLKKVFTKVFTKKVAVDDINLNMYTGQITALLGHNGAGKTTTMSMLTGFLPPTSGTAKVNGYDIRKDLLRVRQSLGFCPQHDVLFPTFTVKENLTFFAQLKGLKSSKVKTEVRELISLLRLEEKTNIKSSKLSGGMKRRLCVGIAMCGQSKVVILDEPTSGLDPEARRQMWDILLSQKAGRTMVLSTHFMDEADLLGDRIAIMAEGKVKCCGSSLFLKGKFGVGYHLVMVKEPSCNVNRLTKVIHDYVPEARLESDVSAEVSYVLPSKSVPKFEALFTFLEDNKSVLGLSSFGASVTTMEEVFMKSGQAKIPIDADDGDSTALTYTLSNTTLQVIGEEEKNTGWKLFRQQFKAMIIKRVLNAWRNRLVAFSQITLPLLFTAFAGLVMNTRQDKGSAALQSLNTDKSEGRIFAFSSSKTLGDGQVDSLASQFESYLLSHSHVDQVFDVNTRAGYEDGDFARFIGDIGSNSMETYNKRLMIGAEFTGSGNQTFITARYNDQAFHTIAMSLNALSNIILKTLIGDEYSISAENHPLQNSEGNQQQLDIQKSISLILLMLIGLSFLVSSFVIFIIQERVSKSKHMQFVSGVHPFNYWISTFVWDFINFYVPAIFIIGVFVIFDIEPFYKDYNAGAVLLLFALYAWAALPFTYASGYLFKVPSTGYTVLTVFNIFTGGCCVSAMDYFKMTSSETGQVAWAIEWGFHFVLPNYNFGLGLWNIYSYHIYKTLCSTITDKVCELISSDPAGSNFCCPDNCHRNGGTCFDYEINVLSWTSPGIGKTLCFLIFQGMGWFIAIFLTESDRANEVNQRYSANNKVKQPIQDTPEDADVQQERLRITEGNLNELLKTDILLVRELRKLYGSFLAVNGLTIGIPRGECFGLLGVNGAGKTTTFKMLTGDIPISSGEAYLDGYNIKKSIRKVRSRIGYCPQYDALIDRMTVKETLWMYARLRGVKEKSINGVVKNIMENLTIQTYKDKRAGELSGGNKRKLSTGISVVGDPPVIYLDEPSTGMDPGARRHLWKTLTKLREQGKTLILTSHSMEECEALCTRLAIMVNGRFQCIGTTQHLKTKFGEGYTLLVRIGVQENVDLDTATEAFCQFVNFTFPGSNLKDKHHGQVYYQITGGQFGLGMIFGIMERAKDQYNIEDYSVSQTTLDQVFINLARAQARPQSA